MVVGAFFPSSSSQVNLYRPLDRQDHCVREAGIKQNDCVEENVIFPGIDMVCMHTDSLSKRKPLQDLLMRMNQECRKEFKEALIKQDGYFYRFFSSENWEEWSERQTPLGKVVSAILYDAEHLGANKFESLSCETLDQANAQAKNLLDRLSTRSSDSNSFLHQLKTSFTAFTRFFPQINFIPGAEATSLSSDCLLSCEQPEGSYQQSCVNSTVTLLPEGLCSLKTYCASMFVGIPHQFNELFFLPNAQVILGNNNGTLTVIHPSVEEANQGFGLLFKESARVQKKLDDLTTGPQERKELESEKEMLKNREKALLGQLPSGSVVSVIKKKGDLPEVLSIPEFKADYPSFAPLQEMAQLTGGVVGFSRNSYDFPVVVETVLDYILKNAPAGQPIDLAFVLDTTSSMKGDIDQVKANLVRYLNKMKEASSGQVRVALLEYRDVADSFLNRIQNDFTTDINAVIKRIQAITTDGGFDEPEALYDALLAAQNDLTWNPGANHIVLAITDASPHSTTVDGLHDNQYVIDEYRKASINIAFYPILTHMRA